MAIKQEVRLRIQVAFQGPSPYAIEPVLLMELNAPQAVWSQLEAGVQHVLQRWPIADEATTVDLEHGDRPERTALVLVRWARAALNTVRGFVNEAGARAQSSGVVNVWLGYHDAQLSLQAFRMALEAARDLAHMPNDAAVVERVDAARQALGLQTLTRHPDYQIRYVMQAARARDVPVLPLVRQARVWQVGWGARQRVFLETASHNDSLIGGTLAKDKGHAKQFLSALGAPVAPHVLVSGPEGLASAVQHVGWPCVVKPLNLGGGRGVTADIRTMEALRFAFDDARRFSPGPIMVERHVEGDDHRLLVINGRLLWAARRSPSFVTGDGQRTLRQLIDGLNAHRRREQAGNQHLIPVVEDDVFHRHLAIQGVESASVLAPGRRVTMRSVSNLSMGGTLEFVTERVHPRVRIMAESLAVASGISTIGLDYITTNIGDDWHSTPGAFVEFNTTPGLDGVELHPGGDPAKLLGDALLGDKVGRIPALGVLMTQQQWLEYLPRLQACVQDVDWGASGPQWVWANGTPWRAEGRNANQAAQTMLHHPTVNRAVVVAVSEELVQLGFPLAGLERLIVESDALPLAWQDVAARIAHEVVKVDGMQALDDCLVNWMFPRA